MLVERGFGVCWLIGRWLLVLLLLLLVWLFCDWLFIVGDGGAEIEWCIAGLRAVCSMSDCIFVFFCD